MFSYIFSLVRWVPNSPSCISKRSFSSTSFLDKDEHFPVFADVYFVREMIGSFSLKSFKICLHINKLIYETSSTKEGVVDLAGVGLGDKWSAKMFVAGDHQSFFLKEEQSWE